MRPRFLLKGLLVSFMLLCSTHIRAYDFTATNDDDATIYYNITSSTDRTCEVTYRSTSYNSYSGNVVIPDSVTNSGITYTVTTIGSSAFENCVELTSVTIPNSVTTIGRHAFYNCTSLTEATIPNSMTSIRDCAFEGCTELTSVTIPDSVTTIGSSAFYNCSGLREVIYNAIICTSAGSSDNPIFSGCTNISIITIGENVTIIPNFLFYACKGVTELNFTAIACTSAGSSSYPPFRDCSNLTTFSIGDNVTIIPSYLFYGCSGLTSVTIPVNVTEIGNGAFGRCTGLMEVTIPNSLTTIGESAFWNCTGLTKIDIPESVTTIGESAFRGCGLVSVDIPNSVSEIEKSTFEYCSALAEISIPESVIAIGENAFYECTELREVTIPINVAEIGDQAFYNCMGLTEITFNAAMCTSAGSSSSKSSFCQCEEVERINIGEKVSEIPPYTFSGCSNIKKITSLAQNPPTIYSSTFGSEALEIEVPEESIFAYMGADICANIPKLYATDNGGNEYYPVIIYYDGDPIVLASGGDENEAIIKNGSTVKIIPINANEQISGFVQHRANDITDILNKDGEYSFTISEFYKENVINSYSTSPSNLYDITVEEAGDVLNKISVANINSVYSLKITGDINGTDIQTIRRMPNLQMLDLSDANIVSGGVYYDDYTTSDNEIGKYFFYDMTSLKSVKLPINVTSINDYAFGGCTNIRSITIPQSVTSIDTYSFIGCTSLRNLAVEDGTEILKMSTLSSSTTPFCDSPIETIYMGRTISYSHSSYGTTHYYSPFSGNKNLVSVEIGNNVIAIYENEFQRCTCLSHVTIGSSVESIENTAFAYCRRLIKLTIGSSVTSIGSSAFRDCMGLTEITIPNSVTEMYCSSFEGCTTATKLTYEDGEEKLNIKFSDSTATPIFTGCESLYLGRNLDYTKLISYAVTYSPFEQATKLWSVTIGDKVTTLPSGLFSGCTGLASVDIPNSVVTIGSSAFYDCSSLTEVYIPNNVATIGSSAFQGCMRLTDVSIGESVTSIGSSAFQGCSNLETINSVNPTPPDITSSTFSGVEKETCVLNVPIGSLNAYWVHVYWGEFFNIKEVDFPDGIDNVGYNGVVQTAGYYTLDGKKISSLQRGINIIRYSDGTAKKVLVK